MLWLFGALIAAMLLSNGLRVLLQTNDALAKPLLRELPADAVFHLQVLLFILCLLGVYIMRVAVAAVDSLIEA